MRRLVYVQKSTVLNTPAPDIVAPLIGRMDGLAILQPISLGAADELKFRLLLDAADAAGLEPFWWFCPGHYSFGRTAWTVKPRPGREGKDSPWLNFSLAEVREHVASVAAEMLTRMGYRGLNFDYIRWRWDILEYFTWASSSHITETVRLTRVAIGDKLMTAAVIRPEINQNTGEPRYMRFGQMWPDWLQEEPELLNWAQPMCYAPLETLREWLNLMPDDHRLSPIVTVGPIKRIPTPFTPEEFRQLLELVIAYGWQPSIWDRQRVSLKHWEQLPYRGDNMASIIEDLENEIAAIEGTIGIMDDEYQARRATFLAHVASLIAITGRLKGTDAKAEEVAAEL